jgi:hypothetical protein
MLESCDNRELDKKRGVPVRLDRVGLPLPQTKAHRLACDKCQAALSSQDERRLPTFDFLGVLHAWRKRQRESKRATEVRPYIAAWGGRRQLVEYPRSAVKLSHGDTARYHEI